MFDLLDVILKWGGLGIAILAVLFAAALVLWFLIGRPFNE